MKRFAFSEINEHFDKNVSLKTELKEILITFTYYLLDLGKKNAFNMQIQIKIKMNTSFHLTDQYCLDLNINHRLKNVKINRGKFSA